MGSPVDLTLGCSTQAPSSNGYYNHQNEPTHSENYLESLREVEERVRSLEEERRKVEGFKRELPLCIQLLEDAIKTWKVKLVNGKHLPLQLRSGSMDSGRNQHVMPSGPGSRPTLEDFMPFKRRWEQRDQPSESSDVEEEVRGSKRPAWLTEAPLWRQSSGCSEREGKEVQEHSEFGISEREQSSITSSQMLLSAKQRPAGAFLPFIRDQPGASSFLSRPTPRTVASAADLSLSLGERTTTPSSRNLRPSDSEVGSIDAGLQTPEVQIPKDIGVMSNGTSGAGSSSGGGNPTRKSRRCWSPELHRRFVSALHQLGGSQIATPKQIRELMKVDGLTNDEVKSHLQKYRLHTRRPSSSPQSGGMGQSPQLVVLGGIWVPPQYAASGSQPSPGFYNPSAADSPQPNQFCPTSLPQGYSCISNSTQGAQLEMHREPIFEPPRQAGTSQSQSSPQGPLQVTSQLSGATQGPSSAAYHDESAGEEDAKSESASWKCDNPKGEELKKSNSNQGSGDGQSRAHVSEEDVNQAD